MKVNELLRGNNLPMGRMMSYSKSGYREANPHSVCYFNANIITVADGKVWYGDLDLTKDGEALKQVAEEAGVVLYVLRELDGRFADEGKSGVELVKVAVWDTTQEIPFL
jgi:hypothetical protein